MKRELDNLDLFHMMSVHSDRQSYMIETMLLTLVALSTVLLVLNILSGQPTAWMIFDGVLLLLNASNAFLCIRRIIRTRKRAKDEKVLYENARAEILAAMEFEKDGYEVVIEDGENEN